MLVSGAISNLLNGMSQQAPALRLPTQGEDSVNFYPSLVEGLIKRPPSEYFVTLPENYNTPKLHIIERDAQRKFLVLLSRRKIIVYDLISGRRYNVVMQSGIGYLDTDNFQIMSVADYTFIVNKDMRVAKKKVAAPYIKNKGALIYAKQVNYDTEYKIQISGVPGVAASHTTPKNVSTTGKAPETISTLIVCQKLLASLRSNSTFDWTYGTYRAPDNMIFIKKRSGDDDFTCAVSDSRGSTHVSLLFKKAQKFSDLPKDCVHNFFLEITGDLDSKADNYYVRFVCDKPQNFSGQGTWVETTDPENTYVLDKTTMPHALIYDEPNDRFIFKALDWGKREVGDEDSAPDPMFVGSRIEDMFMHRNRLGILSDDCMSLSRAGDMLNFYPKTVTTITDADPISIAVGNETVVTLRHAVNFQEGLLVFADNAQYALVAPDSLTHETASLKVATTYDANNRVRPVNAGATLFFCTPETMTHAGIKEFFMNSETESKNAYTVTTHVPNLIPKNVTAMTCSTTEDLLAVLSAQTPDMIYVYKYYWSDGEKLQAAWFKFKLVDCVIQSIVFFNSVLYLAVRRNTGSSTQTFIEKIDFS